MGIAGRLSLHVFANQLAPDATHLLATGPHIRLIKLEPGLLGVETVVLSDGIVVLPQYQDLQRPA